MPRKQIDKMFKISDFQNSISQHGVLPVNRFEVTFELPAGLKNYERAVINDSRLLTLRCESAQIPGISFASVNAAPRAGYGAVETMPYGILYNDSINLTFLMDAHTKIHRIFYDWSNTIVNYHSKGQSSYRNDQLGPTNKMAAYEVGYKENYTTDITITVFDPNGKPIMAVTAYRAFPTLLPSIDLNWNSTQELMKITIPFTFTDFDVKYFNSTQIFPPAVPSVFPEIPKNAT